MNAILIPAQTTLFYYSNIDVSITAPCQIAEPNRKDLGYNGKISKLNIFCFLQKPDREKIEYPIHLLMLRSSVLQQCREVTRLGGMHRLNFLQVVMGFSHTMQRLMA